MKQQVDGRDSRQRDTDREETKLQCRKLIVVYGVPASGKSSFSLLLSQLFDDCILVSADKIQLEVCENKDVSQLIRTNNGAQLIQWIQKINKKYEQDKKAQFNHQIWKQSRKCCECIVEKISNYRSVVLEDDLLLRSQRKVYKKMSWTKKILYLQILMDSTIQQCLQNLQLRNKGFYKFIITQEIVKKQALKLEKEESTYGIKLQQKDRFQITKKDLLSKMQVVEIKPNDPNDPLFSGSTEKHIHNQSELRQIQIRNFIHETMRLKVEELEAKYGNLGKQLQEKKKLAALLSEWKKKQNKKATKKFLKTTNLQERFKQYLQQIQK